MLQNRYVFLLIFTVVLFISSSYAQCPVLDQPCVCAPSIYEPISIVCSGAGSFDAARRAISRAQGIQVGMKI
jgi:hypothetical protein